MHIALGYRWFITAAGYHLERALQVLGHTVTYVGLPCAQRSGYDSSVPLPALLATLPQPPDLYLWIDPAGRYFPLGIEDLPIPTACYLIDVHLGTWRQQVAQFFDAVFIAQKDYLLAYRYAVGHDQVYWLPLAAALDVHYDHNLPRIYEVGFVGNLAIAHRRTARARRLKLLAERFSTNDFYRPYTPQEVGQVYSQSKIVFNTSIAGDVTMRVFEGTAAGALVITDAGVANGLDELFVPGQEIVTFRDDADLIEKVAYYLEHEDERMAIARAGQQRTLTEHSYTQRVAQMLTVVNAADFQRLAPQRVIEAKTRRLARQKIYTHLYMLDLLFDGLHMAGCGPLSRLWAAAPLLLRCLVR